METKSTHSSKFNKWLELLQQESWQLELIVSGFSIVLVAGSYEMLDEFATNIKVIRMGLDNASALNIPLLVVFAAWFFLLLNLILHVVLRGLWISAIGLRYVSGGIELDKLNFAPKFDRFFRRRMVSYDEYIERLEKLCSVVFAFTFLIIFMFVSVGLFTFFLYSITVFFREFITPTFPNFGDVGSTVVFFFFFFLGIFYLLDFVTLGYFKRKKWLSKVYYPFYRFFGWITFSFLYRPLYYNLIDNKFGRRIGFLLVPYVIIIMVILSFQTDSHPYFPDRAGIQLFENDYYEDLREETDIIGTLSLPSKFVQNGFLQLFIPYIARNDDKVLEKICSDFEPFRTTGLHTDIIVITGKPRSIMAADTALTCFTQLYELRINDSLYQNIEWQFVEHYPNGEKGVLTLVDVQHLDRGRHELLVKRQSLIVAKDSLAWRELGHLPFWRE